MWRRERPEPVESVVLDLASIPQFAAETGEDITLLYAAYGRAVQQGTYLYAFVPRQRHKE